MVLLPPDDLPELSADLVATLASLNVHNFSHAVEEKRICKQDNRISFNNDCISFYRESSAFTSLKTCHHPT